jgi:hypothetical protein
LTNAGEASGQNLNAPEPHFPDERADFLLAFVYQIGTRFGMLAMQKRVVARQDTSADAIARFGDEHVGAFVGEIASGRQSS